MVLYEQYHVSSINNLKKNLFKNLTIESTYFP